LQKFGEGAVTPTNPERGACAAVFGDARQTLLATAAFGIDFG
jgi:hypothetical protein